MRLVAQGITLEAIVTIGMLVGIIVGWLVIISWSQRRRRRGEEASTYNAEGGDAGAGLGGTGGMG